MRERWAGLIIWKPCKRCGRNDNVDTRCSYCGGHGMVGGADGVSDCPDCGCSGEQWPPRCHCGAYRGAHALELYNEVLS